MNPSDLEGNVRHFVADGSGLDRNRVILGHGKGPRDKRPYASVLLIRDRKRAETARRQFDEDEDTITEYRQYRRSWYSVQWYREGADRLCDAFLGYCESDLVQLREAEAGFTVADAEDNFEKGEIDDATDDQWEERRNVNLVIDYSRFYTQRTGRLQTTNMNIRRMAG